MRRVKAILAYDGTNYVGMQRQINGLSIQEVVETALAKICKKEVAICASGRTDAGVHALCQPVHFDFPIDAIELANLKKALNSLLPLDVRVEDIAQVADDFHARYDAKERVYHYKICKARTAFNHRHFARFPNFKIDAKKFGAYLKNLQGEHDFSNFCKINPKLKHNRCDIFCAEIVETDYGWLVSISANRFLHNMIRRIVGSCLVLLQENAASSKILEFLQKNDIPPKYKFTAPAQGLYLKDVKY